MTGSIQIYPVNKNKQEEQGKKGFNKLIYIINLIR
jgi:hypothetical protein